ncbi:unnamed protein product [Linum trigynum]|uniref:Uncharacterized protein n=1 Tax=Linum trigynum TaxID=586398 RepID=A0AAV2F867_9ROSI
MLHPTPLGIAHGSTMQQGSGRGDLFVSVLQVCLESKSGGGLNQSFPDVSQSSQETLLSMLCCTELDRAYGVDCPFSKKAVPRSQPPPVWFHRCIAETGEFELHESLLLPFVLSG